MTDSWRRPNRVLLAGLGVLTVLFLVVPSLLVVPMGFTSSPILEFPPRGLSLQWYVRMFTDRAWTSGFLHSLEVAAATAVFATTLGTVAALGMVRGRFPGKALVNGLTLTPLIVPSIVIAIGMFQLYVRWKITGSLVGLVAAHTALAVPFVVINVAVSLRTIDRDLEMAAQNLGAGPVMTFRRITLPLIVPGVFAGALFAFLTSWDEIIVSIFLTTTQYATLPVVMWEQINQQVDPTVAAVSTVMVGITTTLLLLTFVVRKQAPTT